MKLKALLSAAALVAVSVTPSVAALVANGGFDAPGTFGGGFTNTTSLGGWTVTGMWV